MSIERSGTASSLKAVAGAEGHGGKGKDKVKSGDETDPLAGGGFSALLTSFEPPADPIETADAQLLTAENPQPAALPAADPLVPLDQNLPNGLAMLLAQAGTVVDDKSRAFGDEREVGSAGGLHLSIPATGTVKPEMSVASSVSLLPGNSEAFSLLAQAGGKKLSTFGDERPSGAKGGIRLSAPDMGTVKPEMPVASSVSLLPGNSGAFSLLTQAGGEKLSTSGDERPSGAKGGVRLIAHASGADKSETRVAASAASGAEKLGDFRQNVDALFEQPAQGLSARPLKAGWAEFQPGASATLAESRELTRSSAVDVSASASAISGALVSSGMGNSFPRQADRSSAKSSTLPAGYGIEGIWGQQAFQAGSRVDAPSATADPSTLSLESMVADTVSYWVTQGVQNAELKLDGFGAHPVEVSISLKGDEAHIGFRTDQPEIRQILEGAVAHLKDLLTSEGLVLSGVSVGASGQDGAGAQEQRHRPGARQATITTLETVPTVSHQRANPSVGRAVDLFV